MYLYDIFTEGGSNMELLNNRTTPKCDQIEDETTAPKFLKS